MRPLSNEGLPASKRQESSDIVTRPYVEMRSVISTEKHNTIHHQQVAKPSGGSRLWPYGGLDFNNRKRGRGGLKNIENVYACGRSHFWLKINPERTNKFRTFGFGSIKNHRSGGAPPPPPLDRLVIGWWSPRFSPPSIKVFRNVPNWWWKRCKSKDWSQTKQNSSA